MKFININIEKKIGFITLDRAEIHNAFNDELIENLLTAFIELDKNDKVQVIVLSGEGRSFCAGADLNWMSSMINYSKEENQKDSMKLAMLFETINNISKPVVGKINGAALGGGVGLVCVCDYAITHEKAKFGFTETRLGLVPAVISPYCIQKIGESNARAWFLSGERFCAKKAFEMNLVHEVTSVDDFESRCQEVIESFLKAAPNASKEAKKLIKTIVENKKHNDYTVGVISKLRVSDEGQEGMRALLEKRKPNWMDT